MWKCPICGRVFKNTEQSHYCSVKPKTIDEYIDRQETAKKADLCLIREALKEALPEAEELKNYKTDKGTIRIPYGKVDTDLIKRIAIWCYETGNHA